jgi:hypothetical protein
MKTNELWANLVFWLGWPLAIYGAWQQGYSLWLAIPVTWLVTTVLAVIVSRIVSKLTRQT